MRVAFALSVLAMTTGLFGQEGTRSAQFHLLKPGTIGCPVFFGAQIDVRAVARTIDDMHQNPDAPLLRLTFGPGRTILSTNVVIHGSQGSGLLLPVAGQSGQKTADTTQNFELKRLSGQPTVADAEVRVTQLRLVRWAELTEVTFADGSIWHPTSDAQCRAVPSLFHLASASAQ